MAMLTPWDKVVTSRDDLRDGRHLFPSPEAPSFRAERMSQLRQTTLQGRIQRAVSPRRP